MAKVKIRYYKVRRNGRAFWEPTPAMRRAGFACTPLGQDGPDAWKRAEALNRQWDERRAHPAAPPTPDKPVLTFPPGSVGDAFARFKTTAVWTAKPARTREDWERGFAYIGPVFGRFSFADVTLELIAEWRDAIATDKSLGEAHRAMKIWRALWKVAAAMAYCRRDGDPSLAVRNTAPAGRAATWREGEIVRIVKQAIREGYAGLAVAVAILWDGSSAPVDVRTLTAGQMRRDDSGIWFAHARGKTGRKGVITLSRRTMRLLAWYLDRQFGEAELLPTMPLIRTRRGAAYTKNSFAEDFRDIRGRAIPGDTRKMLDIRRSGAVEAVAGGAGGFALSAKLANSIGQSRKLEATYAPIQVATVRKVDDARRAGRNVLRGNK